MDSRGTRREQLEAVRSEHLTLQT